MYGYIFIRLIGSGNAANMYNRVFAATAVRAFAQMVFVTTVDSTEFE